MGGVLSVVCPDDWGRKLLQTDLLSSFESREEKLAEELLPSLSGHREARVMFARPDQQQQYSGTAQVHFYNYSGLPLFLYATAGAFCVQVMELAPWGLLHATIKLSAFQGAALAFGDKAAPWYHRIGHALLQEYRVFRVEVRPLECELHPPCRPWRADVDSNEAHESRHIKNSCLSCYKRPGNPDENIFEMIDRGTHPGEYMDPAIWSSLPEGVFAKILQQLSLFSKGECSLVCKQWKQDVIWTSGAGSFNSKGWLLLRLFKAGRPADDTLIAWCPKSGMVVALATVHLADFKFTKTGQLAHYYTDWQAESRQIQDLENATLDVEVGTGCYQVHLTAWYSANQIIGSSSWLRFDKQPWGYEQGEIQFLDCAKLWRQEDILVAAMLTPKQSVQWVGIWELKPGSLVWEKIATLSAETEPSIWNDSFETPGVSLEAHIEGNAVTILYRNRYAPKFMSPIAYYIPTRTWRVMAYTNLPECHLSYICSCSSDESLNNLLEENLKRKVVSEHSTAPLTPSDVPRALD